MYGFPRIPPGYVSRPSLTKIIDTAPPLVIIRAEAGAGKSSLIAEWASRAPVTGVVLTVDSGSNSRHAFWSAVADLFSDAGLAAPDSILGGGLSTLSAQDDPRRLLVRAFKQLPGQVTLVVDGFESLTDPEVFEDILAVLMASPHLSVVIGTRTLHGHDLPALQLKLDTIFIEDDQLRLNQTEVAEAVALAQLPDQQGTVSSAIYRTAAGHPLLTRGIIASLTSIDSSLESYPTEATTEEIGARLLREFLLSLDTIADQLDTAVLCSIPSILTVELVETINSALDGHEFLQYLEKQGWGTWTDEANGSTFSLSPLLRSALQSELAGRSPEEVRRVQLLAARWSMQHGRFTEALSHAIKSDDLDLASEVVMQSWGELLRLHQGMVIDVFAPMSLRRLASQPILAMLLALTYNATGFHRVRAFELFTLASASARRYKGSKTPEQRLVLTLIESTAYRLLGRGNLALAAADRAKTVFEGLSIEARESLGPSLAPLLCQTGITFFYGGRFGDALALFEAAASLPPAPYRRGEFHALCLIAGLYAVNGQMVDAAATVARIREYEWPEDLLRDYRSSLLHLAEAYLALERFDFDAARKHVAVLDAHRATIEHWPFLAQVDALSRLAEGQFHEAQAALEAEVAKHDLGSDRRARELLNPIRALSNLATGKVNEAERLCKAHPHQLVVSRAQLELLRGQADRAMGVLQQAPSLADQPVRLRCELLLLRAAAAARLGHTASVYAAADEVSALMNLHQLRMPLLALSRADVNAIRAVLEVRGPSAASDLLDGADELPYFLPYGSPEVGLTKRERVVLNALVATANAEEIAAQLFVSRNTVKSQLRSIYRKLGVSSREEALATANTLHLISEDRPAKGREK